MGSKVSLNLVSVQDKGEGGGPRVLKKLKYKILVALKANPAVC